MNPMNLLQFKGAWDRFKGNHPKFPRFLNAVAKQGMLEGSIFEITVKTPEGKEMTTNVRLQASDVEMFHSMMELLKD